MSDNVHDTDPRLPRAVLPTRYDLTIAPDLGAATFEGDVTITLDVTEAVPTIVCNAHELEVDLVALTQGGDPLPATLTTDTPGERITVAAPALRAGEATLRLHFRGRLTDDLVGFYRSTYTAEDGTRRTLATTQFEAPHAAPRLSLLRRTRVQGGLLDRARGRGRSRRAVERSRSRADVAR